MANYLMLLFLFTITSLEAQSGFQFGVGAGSMVIENSIDAIPMNKELLNYQISGKNPIFIELKMDFAFLRNWQLRSGVQWRWRQINISQVKSETKTLISVPLLVNYRLPLDSKRNYVLGFNAGIAVDNYLTNNSESFYRLESNTSTGDKKTITSQLKKDFVSNGEFLSFNGSFRWGVEFEKDFGSSGRAGLQFIYNYQRGNVSKIITELEAVVYKENMTSEIDYILNEKLEFNDTQSGYQVGFVYYFGQFIANKK